jgi:sec-independent protein translocase protein TatC
MGAEADVRMPLTPHLEELHTRIIRSLLGIAAGFLVRYGFAERLVSWLLRPLTAIRPEQSLVIGTGVTDAFFTKLKVAGVAGVFVASPIVFYQAWKFVAPGLYERERRIAVPFSAAGGH